ncbi:MAG: lipo-like protein [Hyphomicrobiales bacterium]|nr:lipo-like protein [Hyphomicrobiales bacterium]
MNPLFEKIGRALAGFLSRERHVHSAAPVTPPDQLVKSLVPGDVVLVEGSSQVSAAIKYLTQSTWSHAALYVGPPGSGLLVDPSHCFIEADLVSGVRTVGIEPFMTVPTRICRPVGLGAADRRAIIDFALRQLGHRYDLRNIVDLARYLLPTPPVPTKWRRRMIALGSGDPTRAICSTLIAQAFQSINYPVLPTVEHRAAATQQCPDCVDEVLHIRHYSLFVPRDFDLSPYFEIIKPALEENFDYRVLHWQAEGGAP